MEQPDHYSLDMRQLISLSEVVRTGSFSAAAQSMGYTQSAVSQQISRLEQLVGHQLLHRTAGRKKISLTSAGRVLLEHADALSATMRRLESDLDALSQGLAGVLRIGCFESVGSSLLPGALELFLDQFPQVRVVLTELADDGALLERLEADELDLSFVVFPLAPGPFEARPLLVDPYVLVVASDSLVAEMTDPIDLTQFPELPLVGFADMREVHSIESRLGRPDYGNRIVFRSNQNSTLLSLVVRGQVAAVLPRLAVEPAPPRLRVLGLQGVSPRVVGIAWHRRRPLSAPAKGFLRAVEEVALEYEGAHGPDQDTGGGGNA